MDISVYSGGIRPCCGMEVSSSWFWGLDPRVWRKVEKGKSRRVRWPVETLSRPLQELTNRKRLILMARGKAEYEGAVLSESKLQVQSRLLSASVPEAVELRSQTISGADADAVCPVPVTDVEGVVTQLPLKVSTGLVLESLGNVYHGPSEEKFWSRNRCGLQHPYPVGYRATKTYKGVQYKQTIEEGPDGPIFVVGEEKTASFSADSPSKAWSLVLGHSRSTDGTRIHGRKHFGFDYPVVLGLLLQMDKNEVVQKGVDKPTALNVKIGNSRTFENDDEDSTPDFNGHGNTAYGGFGDKENLVLNYSEGERQSKIMEKALSTKQSKPSTWSRSPSLGGFGRLIRLRSDLVEDTLHPKVQILSGQESNTNSSIRGYFQEAAVKLDKLEDLMISGRIFHENLQINGPPRNPNHISLNNGGSVDVVSNRDTSLDSILRRMDSIARSDSQGGNPESSEKVNVESSADTGVLHQTRSMNRLLSPLIQRSKTLLEGPISKDRDKDKRKPLHSRSLVNLLEDWNKRGKSQLRLDSKPRFGGRGNTQPLVLPSGTDAGLTVQIKEECESVASSPIGLLHMSDEDLQRRVEEWGSGEKGRLSVLKEIQLLVVNNRGDEALRIFQKLHSIGVHLHDAVYSVFYPFAIDDWQKRAVDQAKEKSVLVCAPGGAGKSVVASLCLYQALIQDEQSLFVTLNDALAVEHLQKFQMLFGSNNVGSLMPKAADGSSRSPITVVTLETLVKELREGRFNEGSRGSNFLMGLSLAVMDRFHTLGDADYGSMWEEALILLDKQVKLIALSLPMKAAHEVVSWISCIHKPCDMVCCESEPVPKLYYHCDTSGLHPFGKRDKGGSINTSERGNSDEFVTIESGSMTDLQLCIRVLLCSLQTEKFLPLAVSFTTIAECVEAMNVASEVIQGEYVSPGELSSIEEHLQMFVRANGDIEQFVNKEDVNCLLRGFSKFHDGQPPLWVEFVLGLVHDNLVKIVFGTNDVLCKTRLSVCTMALFSRPSEPGESWQSSSEFIQLQGKAGRRGVDSNGKFVFVGSNPTCQKVGAVANSETALNISSHFEPSYSLLLNLLNKHTLQEVQKLVESNYGDYIVQKCLDEELTKLQVKIAEVTKVKEDLEVKLIQKLIKTNSMKLQDATSFTQVDVRVARSGQPWIDSILPGLLFAVLPGPSELLYVILCADNNFRLLPVCAVDHVYTTEQQMKSIYEEATGDTLQLPPLPSKEKWKISPGDYLSYISVGTLESAHVVEVLLQYGVKCCLTKEESGCREEIRSCDGFLATILQQHELMLSSKCTTAWTRSENLIKVLEKAGALELILSNVTYAQLKPLGELVSKLHFVENELWCAMALTSSIIKPLTAPELGAICSALVFSGQQNDSGISEPNSGLLKESTIAHDAPKRLRAALEKLENLCKHVEMVQGFRTPPLRLDGRAVATVHSLIREPLCQDLAIDLENWVVHLLQQTIKLLNVVDDVWGRSTDVLSAIGGTSGLHSLARRAAHLLQKVKLVGGMSNARSKLGNRMAIENRINTPNPVGVSWPSHVQPDTYV